MWLGSKIESRWVDCECFGINFSVSIPFSVRPILAFLRIGHTLVIQMLCCTLSCLFSSRFFSVEEDGLHSAIVSIVYTVMVECHENHVNDNAKRNGQLREGIKDEIG